ncbi:MAG: hypothetical protein IKO35_04730 [Elusimicrobiaceae bacterium]|nr:hypothetical protein [Elusimicrobiaceae bacterium]
MDSVTTLAAAFWAAAQAEAHFAEVLKKLNALRLQIPDHLEGNLVDILDEFHAASGQLQAARYDLQILFRAGKG